MEQGEEMTPPCAGNPSVRRILILGGGYLGTRLADSYTSKEGVDVRMVDLMTAYSRPCEYQLDILSSDAEHRLMTINREWCPDVVFFCISAKGAGVEGCKAIYVEGVQKVIASFPESRIIFCSSTALYGETEAGSVDEHSLVTPRSPEGLMLLEAERQVVALGGMVARLSALYGPGRCVLLDRFLEGKALSGHPERWLNYIHRDDAVSALQVLAELATEKGGIYNISDGHPMMMKDVYMQLSLLLNKEQPKPAESVSTVRRGRTNQRVAVDRMRELGWQPRYVSVVEGISDMVKNKL